VERAKKSVSVFADKNNINESARAIDRNTHNPPHAKWKEAERERERDGRALGR